jgi:hypothetical protein
VTRVTAACAALLILTASTAQAQTDAPPRFPQSREFAVGLLWSGPVSLDALSADLTAPGGAAFPLFRADSDIASGLGFDVHFLERLTERLDIELSGGWARADVRTRVSGDVEGIPDVELTNTLTRFTIEGAALWRLAGGDRTTWFARGSGGWLRELDQEDTLAENGYVINVGGGLKYWFQPASTGGARAGLRLEGRLMMRRTGPSLGDELQVGPVLAASAVFGF